MATVTKEVTMSPELNSVMEARRMLYTVPPPARSHRKLFIVAAAVLFIGGAACLVWTMLPA